MSAFVGLQFTSEYEVDKSEEYGGKQEGKRGSESESESESEREVKEMLGKGKGKGEGEGEGYLRLS